jgi:hypothetical protein
MLYSEIIAVCSQIHTKHINTLYGQKVELLNVQPGGTVHTSILTAGFWRMNAFKEHGRVYVKESHENDLGVELKVFKY